MLPTRRNYTNLSSCPLCVLFRCYLAVKTVTNVIKIPRYVETVWVVGCYAIFQELLNTGVNFRGVILVAA